MKEKRWLWRKNGNNSGVIAEVTAVTAQCGAIKFFFMVQMYNAISLRVFLV